MLGIIGGDFFLLFRFFEMLDRQAPVIAQRDAKLLGDLSSRA